jgi:hypothetical protein
VPAKAGPGGPRRIDHTERLAFARNFASPRARARIVL